MHSSMCEWLSDRPELRDSRNSVHNHHFISHSSLHCTGLNFVLPTAVVERQTAEVLFSPPKKTISDALELYCGKKGKVIHCDQMFTFLQPAVLPALTSIYPTNWTFVHLLAALINSVWSCWFGTFHSNLGPNLTGLKPPGDAAVKNVLWNSLMSSGGWGEINFVSISPSLNCYLWPFSPSSHTGVEMAVMNQNLTSVQGVLAMNMCDRRGVTLPPPLHHHYGNSISPKTVSPTGLDHRNNEWQEGKGGGLRAQTGPLVCGQVKMVVVVWSEWVFPLYLPKKCSFVSIEWRVFFALLSFASSMLTRLIVAINNFFSHSRHQMSFCARLLCCSY